MYFGNCRTLGTCSLCGGPVQVPTVWWGVFPPTPSCGSCGATPRQSHGPVIDMVPSPITTTTSTLIFSSDTEQERQRKRYRKQWRDLKI